MKKDKQRREEMKGIGEGLTEGIFAEQKSWERN
jgi:hypothetical protein